jgi:hypothetical protein
MLATFRVSTGSSVGCRLRPDSFSVASNHASHRLKLSQLNRHRGLGSAQFVLKPGNSLLKSIVGVSGNPSKH